MGDAVAAFPGTITGGLAVLGGRLYFALGSRL